MHNNAVLRDARTDDGYDGTLPSSPVTQIVHSSSMQSDKGVSRGASDLQQRCYILSAGCPSCVIARIYVCMCGFIFRQRNELQRVQVEISGLTSHFAAMCPSW